MKNKYEVGELVCARVNPGLMLIIGQCVDHTYYCRVKGNIETDETVYFEKELMLPKSKK